MWKESLLLVVVFVCCKFNADAKICKNVHATASVQNLETQLRGCTTVIGFLHIVLMERYQYNYNFNVSFPELTEITGNLLFFRVFGLKSIGDLFPNLTIIGGDTLLMDYALTIFQLPNLEEIGLKNLRYIRRGLTRIQLCPKLCYVDTVDWEVIGGRSHILDYFNANPDDCETCPERCKGFCWNENDCQTIGPSNCGPDCTVCGESGQCDLCKLYSVDGTCVSQCPEHSYGFKYSHACITAEECKNSMDGEKWWTFNGECVNNCPEGYANVTEAEGWCTYCGDECRKECAGGEINNLQTADLFHDCTHIVGNLIINAETKTVTKNLDYALGKVREIDGYLKIYRSNAINSLNFLKKLKSIRGNTLYLDRYAIVVFENNWLHKLWNWDNFTLRIDNGNAFFHYNPQLCFSEIKTLIDVAKLPRHYTITDVSPYSNGDETTCDILKMTVTVTDIQSTRATITWDNPIPDAVGYILYYSEDPYANVTFYDGRKNCFDDNDYGWLSIYVTGNTEKLEDLVPYTRYALYVQPYTSYQADAGHSPIYGFETSSHHPSEPADIRVSSAASDAISLTWNSPKHPGGKLTHYELELYSEEDDPNILEQRNFCEHPHIVQTGDLNKETPLEVWTDNGDCCKEQNWREWGLKKVRRSINDGNNATATFTMAALTDTVHFTMQSLKHYRIYTILLKVCNDLPSCSASVMLFQRTRPKEDADNIPEKPSIVVNKTNVFIKWPSPSKPNSFITSYLIMYKRIDLKHSLTSFECITTKEHKESGYGYNLTNLLPGNYSLRVAAASLAGLGKESEHVYFNIQNFYSKKSGNARWIYYLLAFTVLIVMILPLAYAYYYKRKSWALFRNSPSSESVFIESYYELDRRDLDMPDVSDEGQLKTIRNGFIKSQNRPCTIKVGRTCTYQHELNVFLKDAFNVKLADNAYHVVPLLGIVSKVQPPLIVMELLAWGDLKSFLKQSKDDQIITHERMYRMAAEIADGMMFLASKKIVHQDLAARNCMVAAGHTVKIVNFSISKDTYETDYFKHEVRGSIPVRWMAPESLADYVVTTNSNVWSYGIILWEMVTFGELPYRDLSDKEVMRYVIGQHVLERPPECPDLLYDMMISCWQWRSINRTSFSTLVEQLSSYIRRDFRLVSFYHSKEAAEFRNVSREVEAEVDVNKGVRWTAEDDKVHFQHPPATAQQHDVNLPSTSSSV